MYRQNGYRISKDRAELTSLKSQALRPDLQSANAYSAKAQTGSASLQIKHNAVGSQRSEKQIGSRTMAKIYLVDDDENILTSVSMFLEDQGYEVRKFHDGVTALAALKESPPDLAVFDVKMPRMDGLELLRRLRQSSNLPVIFLTSKDDEFDEAIGLNMGADDYIKKPFSQRLLGERIKAVLRRAQLTNIELPMPETGDEKVIKRGKLVLDPNRHACSWDGQAVRLTVTEFLILESLAKRPGYVKSRDQLMDAAYEDQIYVDDRTIDSHIKRLRKKFRKTDKTFDGIETLYGVGYKYKEA